MAETSAVQQPPPPFTLQSSGNFAELLNTLGCSLALSTYQAGKVVFISAKNNDDLIQLPRTFQSPMGVAVENAPAGEGSPRLAIAAHGEVISFANAPDAAARYPRQPNTYDSIFLPRARHYVGKVSLHDLSYGEGGLWGVNTAFSCLMRLSERHGFEPVWKPPFISSLEPEDRCHMNGLAMKNGRPEYVTMIDSTDTAGGWRDRRAEGHGLLMHVPSNKIVAENLYMPHSPRVYHDGTYLLASGTGELLKLDEKSGKTSLVIKLDGFARGMSRIGDFVFIGLSKLRKKQSTFQNLPVSERSMMAGVVAVDLRGPAITSVLRYQTSVEEIYDVQVLPGLKRPGILSPDSPEAALSLSRPGATYWGQAVPEQQP